MKEAEKKLIFVPKELDTTEISILVDMGKHVSTLASGVILILIAFRENITRKDAWQFLLVVSFVSLIFSITTALFSQGYLTETVLAVTEKGLKKPQSLSHARKFLGAAFISFAIGMIALVVYGLKNL